MANPTEMIFVHQDMSQEDIDLFLGPLDEKEDGPIVKLESGWLLAHVIHRAGLFPSVSQARKTNPEWNKPIPPGFSSFVIGKKKFKIFILNSF